MKSEKVKNSNEELEVLISYVQLVYYTLKNSATDINPESLKNEVIMYYTKFGNEEVKKMAKLIIKDEK